MKQMIWVLILVVFAMAGCAGKQVAWRVTTTRDAATTQAAEDCQTVDDMDFLDCMVKKTKCTVADGVRAVCILVNDGDVGKSYEERYQFLVDRGMVRENWKLEPEGWIDRGTLSYMLLKAAGMKGGVNMRLFGSWGLGDRRYAYREMLYYELMPEGVDYCYVSGPEMVTSIGNVNRFMQEHAENSPEESTDLGESSQQAVP